MRGNCTLRLMGNRGNDREAMHAEKLYIKVNG